MDPQFGKVTYFIHVVHFLKQVKIKIAHVYFDALYLMSVLGKLKMKWQVNKNSIQSSCDTVSI